MICPICKLPRPTEEEEKSITEEAEYNYCWREWNSACECYDAEERIRDAAVDMLAALERCDPGPDYTVEDDAHDGGIFCELTVGDIRAIRAAIAKATGKQKV